MAEDFGSLLEKTAFPLHGGRQPRNATFKDNPMRSAFVCLITSLIFLPTGSAMAQQRIQISSEWGNVTATLSDNEAARALMSRLPVTLEMRDHLRQEKTGNLPSSLPQSPRQQDFSVGTLGLWGPDHFVIYYRSGRVPQPGIVILGHVQGNAAIFDRPGPITVRVQQAN